MTTRVGESDGQRQLQDSRPVGRLAWRVDLNRRTSDEGGRDIDRKGGPVGSYKENGRPTSSLLGLPGQPGHTD